MVAWGLMAVVSAPSWARGPRATNCQKVVLSGEVSAGQEWRSAFGQGWNFRLVPIQPGKAGYSGWDLVVDREQAAGFPDALLVATPPYNSLNEHEVGTTFGLRAQDAIGWNPRSFHFLTSPEAFKESQRLFLVLGKRGMRDTPVVSKEEGLAMQRQLEINEKSSAGQFCILDARLAPGVADAASYAENWALASARTPHSLEPVGAGHATPLGELRWIKFSVTLWLPGTWIAPRELHAVRVACSE
jgi:hypothetical protein